MNPDFCPFDGELAVVEQVGTAWAVRCSECGALGPVHALQAAAIERWNARARCTDGAGGFACPSCGGPTDELCSPCRADLFLEAERAAWEAAKAKASPEARAAWEAAKKRSPS